MQVRLFRALAPLLLLILTLFTQSAHGQEDGFICQTSAKADIVILVDGSWSIGRVNFRLVRMFIENLVRAFPVSSDQTRIGLAQYSGDPRTEWHLNTHSTKEEVLTAVRNLPYKGGNTLTGLALKYILNNSFKPVFGSRTGVPKVGILITDGKSQDDIKHAVQSLKDAGIEMFAIGVKNADENELRFIASHPVDTHAYNVADFNVLDTIVKDLTRTVCERVEQLDREIKDAGEAGVTVRPAAPRNLVTSNVTDMSFQVSWTPSGTVEKYRVVYYASRDGRQEVVVNGDQNWVVLQNLYSLTEYQVAVFAVSTTSVSEALRGSETTLSRLGVSDSLFYAPSWTQDSGPEQGNKITEENGFICQTSAKADIVILVDGSWSIGRSNFHLVRVFIENLVRAFPISPDQTRIGLAQYSGDPKIEWHLNTHSTKEEVLTAVKNLPYKGGNTLTGIALMYILHYSFKPESGSRTGVPKVGILITDGKSQDDIIIPAKILKDAGIEMFAVGVKNADVNELRDIASPPLETHVYNVADFNLMDLIVGGLAKNVFERVEHLNREIRGEASVSPAAPRNLEISNVTARSFRVSWTHAPGTVEKYRVLYCASMGAKPEEVVVNGDQNSVLLQHLNSVTEYQVAVFAIYKNSASEALRGSETTLALPMVNNLTLYDVTHNSMRVRWRAAEGASGYMILYAPLTGAYTGDEKEIKVAEGVTEFELEGLTPATEYTVTVHAMYRNETRDPRTDQQTTLPLTPPRNLRITDVAHSSAKLNWEETSRKVKGYRIVYTKIHEGGNETNTVEVDRVTTQLLSKLVPSAYYEVAIYAIYGEGEADSVTGTFTTKQLDL